MGASFGGDSDDPISTINITPFVDIILVVLIIFMVTTPLIMNPSIQIQLPKAASGEETPPAKLNVQVDKSGNIFLNGKPSSAEELKSEATIAAKNPESQAVIAADREVSHGKVINVIDIIKSSGITKFAISTEKE